MLYSDEYLDLMRQADPLKAAELERRQSTWWRRLILRLRAQWRRQRHVDSCSKTVDLKPEEAARLQEWIDGR